MMMELFVLAVDPEHLGSCRVRRLEVSWNLLVPGTCINATSKNKFKHFIGVEFQNYSNPKRWKLPLTERVTLIWSASVSRNTCYGLRDIYSSNKNSNTLLIWNTFWFPFWRQNLLSDGKRHECSWWGVKSSICKISITQALCPYLVEKHAGIAGSLIEIWGLYSYRENLNK